MKSPADKGKAVLRDNFEKNRCRSFLITEEGLLPINVDLLSGETGVRRDNDYSPKRGNNDYCTQHLGSTCEVTKKEIDAC